MKWLLGAVFLAVACGTNPPPPGSAALGAPADAGSPGGNGPAGAGGSGGTSSDAGTPPDSGNPADAGTGSTGGPPDAGPGPTGGPSKAPPTPERLTTGENAQGITLDDRNVYWAHEENEGGWQHWQYT